MYSYMKSIAYRIMDLSCIPASDLATKEIIDILKSEFSNCDKENIETSIKIIKIINKTWNSWKE